MSAFRDCFLSMAAGDPTLSAMDIMLLDQLVTQAEVADFDLDVIQTLLMGQPAHIVEKFWGLFDGCMGGPAPSAPLALVSVGPSQILERGITIEGEIEEEEEEELGPMSGGLVPGQPIRRRALGGDILHVRGPAPPLFQPAPDGGGQDCKCEISGAKFKAQVKAWGLLKGTFGFAYETPQKVTPPVWIQVSTTITAEVTYEVRLAGVPRAAPPLKIPLKWSHKNVFHGNACTGAYTISLAKAFTDFSAFGGTMGRGAAKKRIQAEKAKALGGKKIKSVSFPRLQVRRPGSM